MSAADARLRRTGRRALLMRREADRLRTAARRQGRAAKAALRRPEAAHALA